MVFRTPEQFDEWFRRSPGGDPWGYDHVPTQTKLDASLEFVRRQVGAEFSGTFVELGAFQGVFTKRLATAFPKALIQASDVAPFAVELAQKVVGAFPNVRLSCANITTFEKPAEIVQPVAVLLMDCHYFLPEAERAPALMRLVRLLRPAHVFIVTPIIGGDYPTEEDLIDTFRPLAYRVQGLKVLSRRRRKLARIDKIISIAAIRRRAANHVIYHFAPS